MSKDTGVLEVLTPSGVETFRWNGDPQDRAKARKEFEARMESGMYLATVATGPKSKTQIRSFSEAEQIEKQKGLVEVTISPALVGG